MRRVNWWGLGVAVLVVVVWQAIVGGGVWRPQSVPTPLAVAKALGRLATDGELLPPLFHTLWVVAVGSVIALVVGMVVGMALGLVRGIYTWSMASVDFMRTVPVVALLPVAVLVWGPTTTSELIIVAYSAAWIMIVNTAGAFRSVNPRLGDVGRTFRLTRAQTVFKIWLPAITPTLLVGGRLSVISASLAAIISETLVNPQGLGWQIIRAQQGIQPEKLWAYAVVAGLFGYLLNLVLLGVVNLSPTGRSGTAASGT